MTTDINEKGMEEESGAAKNTPKKQKPTFRLVSLEVTILASPWALLSEPSSVMRVMAFLWW